MALVFALTAVVVSFYTLAVMAEVIRTLRGSG